MRVQVAGNGLDIARVGYALVGIRSAVRRNLLRRRLREAVRPALPGLAGLDVVLVAGAEASSLAFTELSEGVTRAVDQAARRVAGSRAVPQRTMDR